MPHPDSINFGEEHDFALLKERASSELQQAACKIQIEASATEKSLPGAIHRLALRIEVLRAPVALAASLEESSSALRGMQNQTASDYETQVLVSTSTALERLRDQTTQLVGQVTLWTKKDLSPVGTRLRTYIQGCDPDQFLEMSTGASRGVDAFVQAIWQRCDFRDGRIRRLAERLGSEAEGPAADKMFENFADRNAQVALLLPGEGVLAADWSTIWDLVQPFENRHGLSFVVTRFEDRVLAIYYDEFIAVAEI